MSNKKLSFAFGVYIHKTKGNFAVAEKPNDEELSKYDFCIYKGKTKKTMFRGISVALREVGTGEYFFNRSLKNYEYLGEL